jgi:hypothetical protein
MGAESISRLHRRNLVRAGGSPVLIKPAGPHRAPAFEIGVEARRGGTACAPQRSWWVKPEDRLALSGSLASLHRCPHLFQRR